MKKKHRIWIGIAIVVLIPILVPLVTLPRAKGDILRALQTSLGRRITASSVHLELVPLPGVELDNVTMSDDPAFGLEDMVMAQSATANISLWNLLRGRVVFSRIHLQSPSINLVRDPAGRWNVAVLLEQTRQTRAARGHGPVRHFPYVDWSDARVNFKFNQTETHFYLDQVKGSLAADGSGWRLHLGFVPARSDLNLSNTGVVTIDGRWGHAAEATQPVPFDMAVHVQQSYLAGSTALLVGHDAGIHGVLSAALQVRGTSQQFAITGTVTAQSLRRWDLLPTSASITAAVAATYTPAEDALTITGVGDPGWQHVELTGTVEHLFAGPRVSLALRLQDVAAAHLLPFALALKANLPASLRLSGTVNGSAALAWQPGQSLPTGHAAVHFAKLHLQDSAASLSLPKAELVWNGHQLRLPGVAATLAGPGLEATALHLRGALDPHEFRLALASAEMGAPAAAALTHLLGMESPWPGRVRGVARVALQLSAPWSQFRDVHWSGTAAFSHALFQPPGGTQLALQPLAISMNTKAPLEARFALTALPLHGSVRWGEDGGLQFAVAGRGVDNRALWSLLRPASGDFVQRVFSAVLGTGAATPAWVQNLQASGSIDLQQLDWHGIRSDVQLELSLAPEAWRATRFNVRFPEGQFAGSGELRPGAFAITGTVPRNRPLHLAAVLAGTPYAATVAGTLSGSLALLHPLTATDLRQLSASGELRLGDGWLATTAGHWHFSQCSGHYRLRHAQITLTDLECRAHGLRYSGSGSAQFADDGALTYRLVLHHGSRTVRLQGPGLPAGR